MTWPFENDTSAIVKKLADRSMKADKRRNAFIIITIAFAVSLMMVLALYNLGTDRENRQNLNTLHQRNELLVIVGGVHVIPQIHGCKREKRSTRNCMQSSLDLSAGNIQ